MAGYKGRQGRKPKPSTIAARERLRNGSEGSQGHMPAAPAYLSDLAKAEWRRTGRPLREAGLLTDLDVSAFGAYCCAYAMHIEAEIKLQDEGMVIVNARGAQVSSPYVAINNQAVAQMRAFMGEFGLTPASRVRMPIGTVSRIPRRPRTTEQGDTPIDPRDTLRWEIQAGNN